MAVWWAFDIRNLGAEGEPSRSPAGGGRRSSGRLTSRYVPQRHRCAQERGKGCSAATAAGPVRCVRFCHRLKPATSKSRGPDVLRGRNTCVGSLRGAVIVEAVAGVVDGGQMNHAEAPGAMTAWRTAAAAAGSERCSNTLMSSTHGKGRGRAGLLNASATAKEASGGAEWPRPRACAEMSTPNRCNRERSARGGNRSRSRCRGGRRTVRPGGRPPGASCRRSG